MSTPSFTPVVITPEHDRNYTIPYGTSLMFKHFMDDYIEPKCMSMILWGVCDDYWVEILKDANRLQKRIANTPIFTKFINGEWRSVHHITKLVRYRDSTGGRANRGNKGIKINNREKLHPANIKDRRPFQAKH